ncbi:substrate-binding domain-containing protein [Roseibium sp.]|uniref:substrate-binding domain-containing protein n=1 Tax=Roseibium sp. TaxID=1936156 RepID=UPI003A97102A
MKPKLFVSVLALAGLAAFPSQARDRILIVGSSTVFPFSSAVAETFGAASGAKTPVVESTGTGGGIRMFCAGTGPSTPDITNASRPMKTEEREVCTANGVTPIEVIIGYDGIVLANSRSGPVFNLTREQLFLALSRIVPADGGMVENGYESWSDISADLPDEPIEVFGPPPTSGTRDAFVELVMDVGCASAAMAAGSSCSDLRQDGAYIEAGENDDLIVGKLEANPMTVGIFGYSFLDQNSTQIQGASIEGVEPSFINIASGAYPVSRPLYFYVKKEHLAQIPALEGYLREFTNEATWGDGGYLAQRGLIPLDAQTRTGIRSKLETHITGTN